MGNQPLKGMARLRAAWANSIQGLGDVWRGEEAFRMEATVLVLSVPLSFWVGRDIFMSAILIAAILLVMIVEVLNSAIEAVVDRIGPERHELSRMAKDLGSLAVLLAMATAGLIWAAAVYVKLTGTGA